MKKVSFFLLCLSFSLGLIAQENPASGFHAGGGLSLDPVTGAGAIQFNLGFSYQRLYLSANKTLPVDQHTPTLTQYRLGLIVGGKLKAILYAGSSLRVMRYHVRNSQEREDHPERFLEYRLKMAMTGAEFSYVIGRTGARIFADCNLTLNPTKSKSPILSEPVLFAPIVGVKMFLINHSDDCYPTRSRR